MDDAKTDRAGGPGDEIDPIAALSGADLVAHLVDVDGMRDAGTDDGADDGTLGVAAVPVEDTGQGEAEVAEERSPSVPGRAMAQPDGGVVVTLGEWLSRVRRGRKVEALAVAMVEPEVVVDDGGGAGDDDGGDELHETWSEDSDGFVVEDRQDGSVVQTWVPAVVSDAGDVKPATGRPPGGRRRRANVEGGRRHRHKVLVTPAEEAKLQVLAHRKGITVPRLLVEAAFAPDTQTVSERRVLAAQLMEFDRVVSGVAVNMNQIARTTNTGYALPADFVETQALLRSVLDKITEGINLLNELNYRDLGE